MNGQTRVEITIRVQPADDSPYTKAETVLLFGPERTEAQKQASVENAARALYPRAAQVTIPTPVREGGRG